jgi:hypothetical protein
VQLSDDRCYFVHADGTPFFWLGGTAWNGPMKAKQEDWEEYLATRRAQGFTCIQCIGTPWRAGKANREGDTGWVDGPDGPPSPAWYRRIDDKIAAANRCGLMVLPIILHTYRPDWFGLTLPIEKAARFVRYVVARWGAWHVMWTLGGDGHYWGEKAERWRRLGRMVFGPDDGQLVTMHPCGVSWIGEEFRDEPWFDFIGYQSGHGDSEEDLRWFTAGEVGKEWAKTPHHPVINLEPNYEAWPAYQSKRKFTPADVRRAAYWSLLLTTAAGVAYGHTFTWDWPEEPRLPEDHEYVGIVGPWREVLHTPGVASMTVLRSLFDSLNWWRLRPAQEMVATQPGDADPTKFIAAGCSADGDFAVVYLPEGVGAVSLIPAAAAEFGEAIWFDPRTAGRSPAQGPGGRFETPDGQDWVLLLGGRGSGQ